MMGNWKKHRDFAEGVTLSNPNYRGHCPFCGGKNTFTANKELSTLQYNCYKLGCDVGGRFDSDMTASDVMKVLRPAPVEPDKEPDTMVIPAQFVRPETDHKLFHRFIIRWGLRSMIADGRINLYYDVQKERVVFPIYKKGRIIDAVGRAVGHSSHPKWYRYTGESDYYIAYGKRELRQNTVVLVEDVVSALVAIRECPFIDAMAILGTSINDKHMEALDLYDRVVVALDPDAADKTLKFRRDIELWTGRKAKALRLQDDIKYCMTEDLESLRKVTQ